jgi:V/A-type H+-transporting ATPase subunit E
MSEQLQGLLDRIYNDGIKKTESEKEVMIAQAKREADDIIARAKTTAELIISKSEEDAKKNENRAKASIQQASRDVLISLEENILKRLSICVKDLADSAMTPDLMTLIIKKMVDFNAAKDGSSKDLSLIFSPKDVQIMADYLKLNLAMDLKAQPEIIKSPDMSGGVKIGFKGQDVYLDFSDATLTDIICGYVGTRLAEILRTPTSTVSN